jgi:glycosyltransferase involved in cell wall biosynthesis
MKILLFSQLFSPAIYGGGEVVFSSICQNLARRGHSVTVITQRLRGAPDYEENNLVRIFRVGKQIDFRGNSPSDLSTNLSFLIHAATKATRILSEEKFDIIHSNTYVPALVGQACSSLFRVPHIITVHDVYFIEEEGHFWESWSRHAKVGPMGGRAGKIIEQIVIRLRPTVFHAVSHSTRDDLLRAGRAKVPVVVVPNAIDVKEYPLHMSRSEKSAQAIYIGRLVFYKNLGTLLQAFREVATIIKEARLVIVGDGPLRRWLEEEISHLGLANNVRLVGVVKQFDKLELLRDSDLLIQPSFVEGFGMVILEAFATGRPVLVSRIPALEEIVHEGVDGLTFSPFDVNELALKMRLLFENESLCERMGRMGRDKVERSYSLPLMISRIEDLYRNATLAIDSRRNSFSRN